MSRFFVYTALTMAQDCWAPLRDGPILGGCDAVRRNGQQWGWPRMNLHVSCSFCGWGEMRIFIMTCFLHFFEMSCSSKLLVIFVILVPFYMIFGDFCIFVSFALFLSDFAHFCAFFPQKCSVCAFFCTFFHIFFVASSTFPSPASCSNVCCRFFFRLLFEQPYLLPN